MSIKRGNVGVEVDGAFSRPPRVCDLLAQQETLKGKEVEVLGWVRSSRAQKSIAFIDVSDGSCHSGVQVVVDKDKATEAYALVKGGNCSTGTSVRITGTLVDAQRKQSVEVQACRVEVLGECSSTYYPLQKKKHSLEFLRSIAHLRPRTNTISAMTRVRSTLTQATHEFFKQNGFLYVNTPVITTSDCEGAGEAFSVVTGMAEAAPAAGEQQEEVDLDQLRKAIGAQGARVKEAKEEAKAKGHDNPNAFAKAEIDALLALKAKLAKAEDEEAAGGRGGDKAEDQQFFGGPAYLTVSGQLEAEAYACAVRDVYTFGPTFRAENSNTTRHLAEFWMIEPELAFAGLDDIISCSQAYIKYCLATVLERNEEDIRFFSSFVSPGREEMLRHLLETKWHRITYTEAVSVLQEAVEAKEATFEYPVEWGQDLQTEHERYLTEKIFEGSPVYVTDYPKGIKAFYMRLNQDKETVAATDLLVPGIGELIGGSAREERPEVLEQNMKQHDLMEGLWWYRELRTYGTVPHAGFGLGFERLVQMVTGLENIRDVTPFPRYPGHAEF